MRFRLYTHDVFLGHDTGMHPENSGRLIAIRRELERRGLYNDLANDWEPATDAQILAAHAPALLETLTLMTARGGGAIDHDTLVMPDSLQAARLAAGAAIDAVLRVGRDEIDRAMVLGRPPGHHATRTRAMGFCLLNSVAIAARAAQAAGARRVAILDFDVHHGNGTQDIFYGDADVIFCSSHRYDGWYFPGTGANAERGVDAGQGTTLNVPLDAGADNAAMLQAWESIILPAVERFGPDVILVSAGYDAHIADPIGDLSIDAVGFRAVNQCILHVAHRLTQDKVVYLLEGGYHPVSTAISVADTIELLRASSL